MSRASAPPSCSAKTKHKQMQFVVEKDFETGTRAGADGRFQITSISIEDADGGSVDISRRIEQGKCFNSDEDLKTYISGRFHIPLQYINIMTTD
jgi:hypothetical protein